MFYVEWIEQPLRITDSLAIDEPVNMKMCNKQAKVLKAKNISPTWRGKRHFVYVFQTYTLSQVLYLSLRTKQLSLSLFSIVILYWLSPCDIYIHTAVLFDLNHLPSAPTRSIWGFKTPFPNQRIINIYICISIRTSL